MAVSAEIRWFWHVAAPVGLEEWFRHTESHSCPAGGGTKRIDEYLRDGSQQELGVKRRGGRPGVEVKGLVAITADALEAAPFIGPIELWTKWASAALDLGAHAAIAVEKQRWIRRFDTSVPSPSEIPVGADEAPLDHRPLRGRGCNLELTSIKLPAGDVWWTLGFEACGTLYTVEIDLRRVAGLVAGRKPPPLGDGCLASYPAWLRARVT